MILDAIFSLFGSIFGIIGEGITVLCVPLINLITAAIEAVVGIFVTGFRLGRIERKKSEKKSTASAIIGSITLLLVLGLIGWFFLGPKVMNRKVTLVAVDGYSLPYAALIIHTGDGDLHKRTDNAGNIVIPRFGIESVTLKDPRYIEKTWNKSELQTKLVADRTVLGAGLDSLAEKLLKRAKE